jgi:hypothetical protein
VFVGYALDLANFGLRSRLSACHAGFDNAAVQADVNAYDLELRLYHAWDVSRIALELGLGAGLTLFQQEFQAHGEAPDRTSLAPFFALGAGAQLDLGDGFYVGLDAAGETHFMPLRRDATSPVEHSVSFALRASLAAGRHF